MVFYNTNQESGQELDQSRARAMTQQDRVLGFFKTNPTGLFSTREVHEHVFFNRGEVTSTQRCITNLTNAKELVKTTEMMRSKKYGKKVHRWRLNLEGQDQEQMRLFG